MTIRQFLALATLTVIGLAGCTQPAPTQNTATDEPAAESTETTAPAVSEIGVQTHLDPVALAPYTIESLYTGELKLGHFNLYVTGGELAALRTWVGDENATNVVVTKADWEVDHYCAQLEVPESLTADARLWVELETTDGARLKGSTELK